MSMGKINLKSLSVQELTRFMDGEGLPGYRAQQLMQWIYERGVRDIDEITVFSKDLRARLKGVAYISSLELMDRKQSVDGTQKYLFRLEDGLTMESVLIAEDDRLTLCISSQVGCQMGCAFCRTASMGFKRSLEAFEIVDQVISAKRLIGGARIRNIVFMGMGEPFMNLDAVVQAILMMNTFLNLSRRRITVSTSGLPAGILQLPARLKAHDIYINLAISLNATTNQSRSSIMPVNRKHPIDELMAAVRRFPLPRTRKITFEYVLIAGVNDSHDDALRLSRLLKGIPNKVNVIPLNEFEGCHLRRPSDEHVAEFMKWLEQGGLTALLRKSKGQDILASCGQLASDTKPESGGRP